MAEGSAPPTSRNQSQCLRPGPPCSRLPPGALRCPARSEHFPAARASVARPPYVAWERPAARAWERAHWCSQTGSSTRMRRRLPQRCRPTCVAQVSPALCTAHSLVSSRGRRCGRGNAQQHPGKMPRSYSQHHPRDAEASLSRVCFRAGEHIRQVIDDVSTIQSHRSALLVCATRGLVSARYDAVRIAATNDARPACNGHAPATWSTPCSVGKTAAGADPRIVRTRVLTQPAGRARSPCASHRCSAAGGPQPRAPLRAGA